MKRLITEEIKHEIIIDKIACPLHVLAIKNGMKQVASGEILKIVSTENVASELLAAAKQIGQAVDMSDEYEIYILKA